MQPKRKLWVYVVLVSLLLALAGFSGLPLISSILQENQLLAQNDSSTITPEQKLKLEAEASGYQKVLEREPDNQTALQGLLSIRLQQQDLRSAIIPLEKLAQLNPEQPEYTMLVGQAKQQLQDYEGAIAAYRQVLADNPGNLLALTGMTNLYLLQNLPERAIAQLQDTLQQAQLSEKEQPSEAVDLDSVKLLLGEVYAKTERYSEATALYEQVSKSNPQDFRPVLAEGLLMKQQGLLAEAKSRLEQALSLAPSQFKDQISQMTAQLATEEIDRLTQKEAQ